MTNATQTKNELKAAKERAQADKAKMKSFKEEIEALQAEAKVSADRIIELSDLLKTADDKTAEANKKAADADEARSEATKLTEAANIGTQEAVEKIGDVTKERDEALEKCTTLQEKMDELGVVNDALLAAGEGVVDADPEGKGVPDPDAGKEPDSKDVVDLKGEPQVGSTPSKAFAIRSAGGDYVCACAKNKYRAGTIGDALKIPTHDDAKTFLDKTLKKHNSVFQSGWSVVDI